MDKNLQQRIKTAFIFVSTFVLAVTIHPIIYSVVFLGYAIVGLSEFFKLAQNKDIKPNKTLAFALTIMIFVLFTLSAAKILKYNHLLILIPIIYLVFIFELYRNSDHAFRNIAFTVLGIFYVSIPISMNSFLAFPPYQYKFTYKVILAVYILIWANDTGAYIIGRIIGKHKLFKRISPGKSWEGLIGGVITTILASWLVFITFKTYTITNWIIIGIITAVTAIFGDLVESLLKRSVNVKDSGHILPGHGGILDRFDSSLLTIPTVVTYIQFHL